MRGIQLGPGLRHIRLGGAQPGDSGIVLLLTDCLLLYQSLVALHILSRIGLGGQGAIKRCLGCTQGGLHLPGVHGKERRAGLHVTAFSVEPFLDDAIDPRPDFRGTQRLYAPGCLDDVVYGLGTHDLNLDLRSGWRSRGGLLFAAGDQQQSQKKERGDGGGMAHWVFPC